MNDTVSCLIGAVITLLSGEPPAYNHNENIFKEESKMNETLKYGNFVVTINTLLPEEFDFPEDAKDTTLCHLRIFHHDKKIYDELEFISSYVVREWEATDEYDIDCPDGIEHWVYIYLQDNGEDSLTIGLDLHRDNADLM